MQKITANMPYYMQFFFIKYAKYAQFSPNMQNMQNEVGLILQEIFWNEKWIWIYIEQSGRKKKCVFI